MPVASPRQTRTTRPLTRPVPTPSTAPMITAAIPSGAGWPTRNMPPRATLRISGISRLRCVTGSWIIWRAKMKTTITRASNAVTITLIFIRTLLLYRRHLGGPTIRSHFSRRPSRDVSLFSATGIYREQDHQRCSKKQCSRCPGGFTPIKGWEKGWVFLRSKKEGEWQTAARGVSTRVGLHDVEFPCARNGLRPALYLEFAVDRVDIPFHRAHRDHEPVRNLSIRAARDDQPQHLQLAFAQRFTERVHSRPSYSRVRHVLVMRCAQQCQELFS